LERREGSGRIRLEMDYSTWFNRIEGVSESCNMVDFVLAALPLSQLGVSLVKISKCFVRILAGQIGALKLD
jgi:hypothetical protein